MEIYIDIGALDSCQNQEESYGEICVKCNQCGRFDLKKTPEFSIGAEFSGDVKLT